MFGYVIANPDALTPEQLARYKGAYCGLCRTLKARHGSLSRLTLTYDMTFLILLLESMYEPETDSGSERCAVHPLRAHAYTHSAVTDYAADMNLALAYQNCLDDWKDEKRLASRAEAALLRRGYDAVKELYPEKCAFIERCLAELAEIEARGEAKPDAGAERFGALMGELFAYGGREDVWTGRLRRFGCELGEFIYIMDAVLDLDADMAAGRYNPLAATAAGKTDEELRGLLNMLAAGFSEAFELLPVVQDADIMRSILYSGVWIRYNAEMSRRRDGGRGARPQTKGE